MGRGLYIYNTMFPFLDSLGDQFAFRPTGSKTAGRIALLQNVTSLLETNQSVVVISTDFSTCKSFDTVRHSSLAEKLLVALYLPKNVDDGLISYFLFC